MAQPDPIVVPASATGDQALTLLRYTLTAFGGLVVAGGYVTETAADEVVGALLVVLPAAWGIYRTWRNNQVQKAMAEELPDRIAKISKEK